MKTRTDCNKPTNTQKHTLRFYGWDDTLGPMPEPLWLALRGLAASQKLSSWRGYLSRHELGTGARPISWDGIAWGGAVLGTKHRSNHGVDIGWAVVSVEWDVGDAPHPVRVAQLINL